jgi:hypothetical protein
MTRLLTNTETALKVEYIKTEHTISVLKAKSLLTPLNEFEQHQYTELETNLKRIKIKLTLKGVKI